MYSFICKPELYSQIRKVLLDRKGNIFYESSSVNQDIRQCLEEASRVNSSVLIVDIDAGTGDIITGVKKFRVARPFTRIIAIAPGREPGDPVVIDLIRKGVYDIIAPIINEKDGEEIDIIADLTRALNKPATYADVVRWDTKTEESGESEEKLTKTTFQERLIGTGVIAVAGAGRGAGATTMAVAIAQYLARQRYKIALIELNHHPVFWGIEEQLSKNIDIFKQSNYFSVYQKEIKNILEEVNITEYNYVVLDMGTIYDREEDTENYRKVGPIRLHKYFYEITRAALPLLIVGAAPWQWLQFAPCVMNDKINKNINSWYVVTPNKDIAKELQVVTNNVYVSPFIHYPFTPNENTTAFLEKLFESSNILPQKKKSNIFSFFNLRN